MSSILPISQKRKETNMREGLHIAIAGNIGVGKTTLVNMLANHYGWKPHLEAVDNNPYLEDFYKDMAKWAFPLQIYFLHSRFNQVLTALKSRETIIQDRTIYEDAYIFAQNLRESGFLTERDFNNYFELFKSMCRLLQAPDLLIYLRARVPKLERQIEKRGRSYELDMATRYLDDLNRNYESWIGSYQEGKLLIIETDDLDYVEKEKDFHFIRQKIEDALL